MYWQIFGHWMARRDGGMGDGETGKGYTRSGFVLLLLDHCWFVLMCLCFQCVWCSFSNRTSAVFYASAAQFCTSTSTARPNTGSLLFLLCHDVIQRKTQWKNALFFWASRHTNISWLSLSLGPSVCLKIWQMGECQESFSAFLFADASVKNSFKTALFLYFCLWLVKINPLSFRKRENLWELSVYFSFYVSRTYIFVIYSIILIFTVMSTLYWCRTHV